MQKTLSEKQLAHALFFSLKHNDLEHAYQLVRMGAPVQTAFYMNQDSMAYTSNFMVGKVAETIKKHGYNHARSRLALQLLDAFIEAGADFRCHCSAKNPHYCSLSEAFKHITFTTEEDLFSDNNLLILKLLYHGATFKNHRNEKDYKWVGVDTLLSYISTRRQDVLQMISSNRHRKLFFIILAYMAAAFYEFMHVSQMLQTIFGLAVSLLAIAQFLMVRYQLWTDMVKIREDEADEYDKWLQAESISRGVNMEGVEDQNSMVRNVQEELNPNAMNTTEDAPAEKPEQATDPVGEMMKPPMPPAGPPVQIKLEKNDEEQQDPFSEYNSTKRQSAHVFLNVTHLFDQNLPIIMCCMVLGMLTVSTYLLTAITFFCYLFFNLVFNYANLIEKLEVKVESKLVPLVLSLLASGWIVAYFGGVLIRDEYQ